MVNIEIDDDGFDDLDRGLECWGNKLIQNLDAGMEGLAEAIRQRLEALTNELFPGGTGKTAASWKVIGLGMGEFYISNSNTPIIDYLTEGTTGHMIFPTVAQALHWITESGEDAFSKGHYIRGIVGIDLETQVMFEMDPAIEQLLDASIDAADAAGGFM